MHPVRLLACVALLGSAAVAPLAHAEATGTAPSPVRPGARAGHVTRTAGDERSQAMRVARPARTVDVDNAKFIDINNAKMFVTNTGSFAYDKTTGNSGLEFPKGTGKTCVFAAGLWLGAQVGGQTRVAVSEYSDEYGPGPMYGTSPPPADSAVYKVYKLYRVYSDPAVRDADLADYNLGAVPHGAPVVTVQPDGSLDILGDEMLWAVYNDADPANHTNRAGTTAPLGVEVQQTTFAFNRQGALGNTIFIKYKIINKGGNQLDNMYVSQWSDPDDGYAGDDLVGCDPAIGLGYVYNATNADNIYGSNVPAVGYDFFQGPMVGGNPLAMTSFNKYINGTDPNNFTKTYNFMQGLNSDGTPVINPVTNTVTNYQVDGDPVTATGWLDTNPADRRLMLSSGPFSMAPGDVQEVVTGIVIGQSSNRLASVSLMKFYDTQAQSAFEQDFNLASPPNNPTVVATPVDGGVVLSWDNRSENYNKPPYGFEGYVVYQGASLAGPFTRVATYDLNNGITVVKDPDFDEQTGVVVDVVKALGNDGGLQYTTKLTSDYVRGGPLHNGTPYYYAVTAYSVGIGSVPQVLEGAQNVITVVPQTPAGGVDLNSASITHPTWGQYTAGTATTDSATATIVDASQVIDATYRIGYKPGADGIPVWYMTRTVGATVDTVINNQLNFSGDASYPVVDGVQAKVYGAPFKQLLDAYYVSVGPNPPGLVPGPDDWYGGNFFGGSADYASYLTPMGSGLDPYANYPADALVMSNVEIRFTGGAPGQKAYRYVRCNCSPRNYNYQDFVDVPFTVWDVDNNRQLDVGFLENYPAADGQWNPDPTPDPFDNSPEDDRQFLSIYGTTYTGAPNPAYQVDWLADGPTLPMWYAVWADGSTQPLSINDGDKFVFQLAYRSPNDYFEFTTKKANTFNASLAKSELDRVLAVPNPYFNHSSYELNQFSRVVKFTHLPAACKIRIFNLAGDLIRTLDKNDNTSQVSWDLLTDRGLPVSSGIYVFHVDAPSVGTKTGKVAIFMEKERLNTY